MSEQTDLIAVQSERSEEAIKITVSGEIDISTIPELSEPLEAALESRPEKIVIDLEPVGFLDSQGLNLLLQTARKAAEQGTRFLVLPPAGAAQRIFEISDFLTEYGALSDGWIHSEEEAA